MFLLVIAGVAAWWPVVSVSDTTSEHLVVSFFDVGQGDAIHIATPDGYEMLIDGGPSAKVLQELSNRRSFFDREIDVVVATHPDTDHVSGLVDVLQRYQVNLLLETAAEHDAPAAIAYSSAALIEGAHIVSAQAGQVLKLGASTTVEILSPRGDTSKWRSNPASIVLKVNYGETSFLFTGDVPSNIEDYLVGVYGADLQSTVLKLGHHGSDTSSSELFLQTVKPEYAVVSAGKDNRYEHPRPEVLERARSVDAQIVSTITMGTITFLSDGERVWLEGD